MKEKILPSPTEHWRRRWNPPSFPPGPDAPPQDQTKIQKREEDKRWVLWDSEEWGGRWGKIQLSSLPVKEKSQRRRSRKETHQREWNGTESLLKQSRNLRLKARLFGMSQHITHTPKSKRLRFRLSSKKMLQPGATSIEKKKASPRRKTGKGRSLRNFNQAEDFELNPQEQRTGRTSASGQGPKTEVHQPKQGT